MPLHVASVIMEIIFASHLPSSKSLKQVPGCPMGVVCGWGQTLNGNGWAGDTVSFTTLVCCTVSLEKRPEIGWQAWEPGANTQIPLVPRASHMAASSVSILLYWFSADCQHNLAAVGSLSELILDGNFSLTLNWVWPHGEFARVCGFREKEKEKEKATGGWSLDMTGEN